MTKAGIRIRIQNQPYQVLRTLVTRAGDVVSREELRQTVWSNDTFVDFEHGLNAAVNKVRQALNDSPDHPRYIETVPGQGYRFIAPVEGPPASLTSARPATPGAFPKKRTWITLATAFMAIAIGMLLLRSSRRDTVNLPVLEFQIPQPAETIFAPPISRQPFAISPNGATLALTATGPNGTSIWTRELASLDVRPLAGTERAWTLFWSPDSRSIFYSVKRTLKQVNLESGSTRAVTAVPVMVMFGTWRSTRDLLLYSGARDYHELQVENGTLRSLPGADMRWPQFLPGGQQFIHVVFDHELGRYRALATNYVTHHSVSLMETDSRVQYAPPARRSQAGHLLFIRGSSLLAQPFEADRLLLLGEPFPIVQEVIYFRPSASACFSVSDNGVLVYQTGFPISHLNWYDRAGHLRGEAGGPAPYVGRVRISPDGRHIAADVWSPENGGLDIWIFEANSPRTRRLTYPPAVHSRPIWSPDGKRIAEGTSRTSAPHLAILDVTNVGSEQPINKEFSFAQEKLSDIQMPTDWSPDGRFVAYDTTLGEEEQEIWLADVSSGKQTPLLKNVFAQWGAVFSPNGKQIAFVSDESGRPEVYVQDFESTPSPRTIGEKHQVSKESAWLVRWRPDGRELFYLGIDNWLHSVPVKAGGKLGEPNALFHVEGTPQYGSASDFQFDVTRDGQRIIMTTTGTAVPPPFTVIENWQAKFHR